MTEERPLDMTKSTARDEMVRLRTLIAADKQQLERDDRLIGKLTEQRYERFHRCQENESRLRSLEARHYSEFAADAALAAAEERDRAQGRAEDFRRDGSAA